MRILCVSGGPGFSSKYLSCAVASVRTSDLLQSLARQDADDCAVLVARLQRILLDMNCDGKFAVVSHSWGCFLTATAMSGMGDLTNLSVNLLVNPVPMERRSFYATASEFRGRLSAKSKAAIIYHACRNNGDDLIRVLLPYYGVEPVPSIISDIDFSVRSYRRGMQGIPWPDVRYLSRVFRNCTVIRGGRDVTRAVSVNSITSVSKATHVIDGAGHFPMYDRPMDFAALLQSTLDG